MILKFLTFPSSKFGLDSSGKPLFTFVGQTATSSAGRVGVGVPTITTYKGQAGTGILWVTDPDRGVQAFNAVPVNGILTPISLPSTNGVNKFQRPAFGNGRLVTSDTNGNVICLGSPVALPLQCSQPVDFGPVIIGSVATATITCTALIPITRITGCSTDDATFSCKNSTLPTGALARGAGFSFPVTWNLTQASINNAQNVSFGKVNPGVKSTTLYIYTTNGVPNYQSLLPASLQGTTVSSAPFLYVSPPEIDFGGIVVGSAGQASGLSAAFLISNIGSQPLVITGFGWAQDLDDDNPVFTNVTVDGSGNSIIGNGFTSSNFLNVGDTIPIGGSVTLLLSFNANAVGSYSSTVKFWSNGGADYVILTGSASTAPIANISVSTVAGGWLYNEPVVMGFGNVLSGTIQQRFIQICNSGGSALQITKSKPPGSAQIIAPNGLIDLHESQFIDVGACATGEVDILAAFLGLNSLPQQIMDTWTLNTNDLNFGVHVVSITATVVSPVVGPLVNGLPRYRYLGCYYDNTAMRLLPTRFGNNTQENGWCQRTCFSLGYIFAGTEFRKSTPVINSHKSNVPQVLNAGVATLLLRHLHMHRSLAHARSPVLATPHSHVEAPQRIYTHFTTIPNILLGRTRFLAFRRW